MGFGPTWGPGRHSEFEIIDFGYNTADDGDLLKLRDMLAGWEVTSSTRARLHEMQLHTVLGGLYDRVDKHRSEGIVPSALADLWDNATHTHDTVEQARDWFHGEIRRNMAAIDQSWFPRDGGDSQWIYDSRLRPAEVEAVMVRAKREVCDLLLSKRVDRCRWLGQCEWPEFSVRVSLDERERQAGVWVYGPDNGMAEDPARRSAARLRGTADEVVGHLVVNQLHESVPAPHQRVPYVASGPPRPVTEIRWQAVAAPTTPAGARDNRRRLLRLTGPIAEQEIDQLRPELEMVQGNILRPHARRHAAHLLLRFEPGSQAAGWLADLDVTTADSQREASLRHQASPDVSEPFIGVGLSASGFRFLRRPAPPDLVFRSGMKGSIDLTGDPAVSTWDSRYQGDIHALLVLAGPDADTVGSLLGQHRSSAIAAGVSVVAEEIGTVLRDDDGAAVEPFGFVDGLSQPLFFEKNVNERLDSLPDVYDDGRSRRPRDGENGWSFGFAPRQVLVPDGPNGENGYGSYLVFRKLEQNLRRFAEIRDQLATELATGPERAGAQLVGRASDGMPALDSITGPRPVSSETAAARAGDFTYQPGSGCPFTAHTRRMNDRTEVGRRRVMARRGIPYNEDDPWSPAPPPPSVERGVGLLFQACVWDLQDQFVDVQREATHPSDGGSPDPLLGPGRCWWADPNGRHRSVDIRGDGDEPLVRMLGGEYFFLPSPAFIKSLAG